jgi:hypothetical protein
MCRVNRGDQVRGQVEHRAFHLGSRNGHTVQLIERDQIDIRRRIEERSDQFQLDAIQSSFDTSAPSRILRTVLFSAAFTSSDLIQECPAKAAASIKISDFVIWMMLLSLVGKLAFQ